MLYLQGANMKTALILLAALSLPATSAQASHLPPVVCGHHIMQPSLQFQLWAVGGWRIYLHPGDTEQLCAASRDESNVVRQLEGHEVIWTSASPDITTVDSNGLVTAVSPGTTYLVVRSKAHSDRNWVTVYIRVDQRLFP